MPKEWVISPAWSQRRELADQLRISPVVAQILHNRGLMDRERIERFLSPRMGDLLGPDTLPGATAASERILDAIRAGRRIVLYGDYDVDGVTGVAILWHCIRLAGGQAEFYIPHRLEEGYGLNSEAIASLADGGAQLIVTVDCGVTAIEAAEIARQRGVELIITDHHAPRADEAGRAVLPDASVIVHPSLSPEVGGNRDLSGSGVAFKLGWAIGQRAAGGERVTPEFKQFLVNAMGLAALGLIADVVPLLGENRVIASFGLQGLPASTLPGVAALIDAAGLKGERLTGYDIGFKIAPRLNAIGRMGHARLAVELLTRAESDEARKIARNLEQHNTARRSIERKIAAEAKEMVRATQQDSDASRAIVLASSGWHAGVIGIVAARLVDEFCRPTVMIALENGTGQGSARSIAGFALHEALAACASHLVSCGGHAMAAGLRIESAKVEQFSAAFHARAASMVTSVDMRPRLKLDDEVALPLLDEKLVRDLGKMEPFGCGNPAPRLATEWLEVVGEPRVVGGAGEHLQVTLKQDGLMRKGIAFGQAKHRSTLCDHRRCRVAFQPIVNEFNGRRSVELMIQDFQFPTA